jgi:hypothetical protein
MSSAVHPFSTKSESWLKMCRCLGRSRIPVFVHTALHWVQKEFNQKSLFDAAIFCVKRGLLSLLPSPDSNVQDVTSRDLKGGTLDDEIILRLERAGQRRVA